ncbi:DinB family protein [Solitalea sp. MAHUQ-68]|uniref:DinB family protein n=1 Tax=Solitalea agri TaxID=2953739 RepID=A0A9X2F2F4_9SPHI|nr:DinB family protein [Solitalea agri]MCO4293367.1 DinB family protein [Solitalea agri]
MFRTIEDFLNSWSYENQVTETLLRQITDKSLNQKVYDEGRTLGQLVWHIAASIPEILNRAGLKLEEIDDTVDAPQSADEIRLAFSNAADQAKEQVASKWLDSDLENEVEMYGDSWPKGKVLSVLILHQAHHRGQLTVLMRQAGLIVTGVYGPAKEEWSSMGMAAAK